MAWAARPGADSDHNQGVDQLTLRRRTRLPTRPQLAAHAVILSRGPAETQVGSDPEHAVVLRGAGFGAWLRTLDGRLDLQGVRAAGGTLGLPASRITLVLELLTSAGLVVEAELEDGDAVANPLPRARLRLVGAGAIGQAIARLLVASDLGDLYIWDDAPPERELYPHAGALATRAQALRSMLRSPVPGAHPAARPVTAVHHWSKPEARLDLTLLVADGPEADRVVADHCLRLDEPHLVVRSDARAVQVGPLVLPGRTPCLRCTDLTRRDADPAWPFLLPQLARLSCPPEPLLVAWAAAVTVAQVRTLRSGEPPALAGATLELGAPDYRLRERRWPAHAGCGCGWSGRTEWAS